jgi:hypothetical protein
MQEESMQIELPAGILVLTLDILHKSFQVRIFYRPCRYRDADDEDATTKHLSLWLQEYDNAADGCKGSEGDAGNVAARDGAMASDYLD